MLSPSNGKRVIVRTIGRHLPKLVTIGLLLLFFLPMAVNLDAASALLEKFVPVSDTQTAERFIHELQARKYDALIASTNPALKGKALRKSFAAAADAMQGASDLTFVKIQVQSDGTTSLIYDATLPKGDALILVTFERSSGKPIIDALQVQPLSSSYEASNALTLSGRGFRYYLWSIAAAIDAIATLVALITCAWLPYVRLRWLWMLFICTGVIQCSLNWVTGAWWIAPVSIAFPPVRITAEYYDAPWILSVYVPLGACLFWWFRPQLVVPRVSAEPVPPTVAADVQV